VQTFIGAKLLSSQVAQPTQKPFEKQLLLRIGSWQESIGWIWKAPTRYWRLRTFTEYGKLRSHWSRKQPMTAYKSLPLKSYRWSPARKLAAGCCDHCPSDDNWASAPQFPT
jgi:hypothetical protein